MKTIIISIGDEVVSGHTVNTNAAWMANELDPYGLSPERIVTMRDDEKALVKEIRSAIKKYDAVFITGGLGPTHDDVTKPALVKVFGTRLVRDEKILSAVRRFFRVKLKKPMPPVNEGQADVPEGALAVANKWGTAPLLSFDTGGCLVFALPGVPYEMKNLMKKEVIPRLKKCFPVTAVTRRILHTIGIGESNLYEMIENAGALDGSVELAYLPHMGQVDLRVTARAETLKDARASLRCAEKKLMSVIGPYCYGKDDQTLESVIGEILTAKKLTLACAESCTGGLFASMITSVSGSSRYFLEGAVTYSNDAKMRRLGVAKSTLVKHGAVSAQVAAEMAEGVAKTSGADISVSATGVAGPTGGTKEKPVGLVYIGLSFEGKTQTRELRLGEDRRRNQERTAQEMLAWVWRETKGL